MVFHKLSKDEFLRVGAPEWSDLTWSGVQEEHKTVFGITRGILRTVPPAILGSLIGPNIVHNNGSKSASRFIRNLIHYTLVISK